MTTPVELAAYLFNEATTGIAPSTLIDSVNSANLAIDYGTASGDAVWLTNTGGSGLHFLEASDTANSAKCSRALAVNDPIAVALNGATGLSFEMVLEAEGDSSSGARGFAIGTASGNTDVSLVLGVSRAVSIRWGQEGDGGSEVHFPVLGSFSEDAIVIRAVIETTEVTAADRVKVFYNGVEQTATSGTMPQNIALSSVNNGNRYLTLGNRENADRNINGIIYYFKLYTGHLDPSTADFNATALLTNNDVDPGALPPNNAPVINDKAFTIQDNIGNSDVVGTITGSDPENATLSYQVTGNILDIDSAGEITIADNTNITAGVDIVETVTVSDDEPVVHFIHGMTNASYLNLNLIDTATFNGWSGILEITLVLDENLGSTAELNVTYSGVGGGGDTTYFIPNFDSEDSGNGIGISATPGTSIGNGKVRYVFELDVSSIVGNLTYINFYHNYTRYDVTVENVEAVGFGSSVAFDKSIWDASATNGSRSVWGDYDTATVTLTVEDSTAFSVTGESTATPRSKGQITFDIANAAGPITVSSADGDWNVLSQTANALLVEVIDIAADGNTHLFNDDIVVTLDDGTYTRQRTIQALPEDDFEFGQITDPHPQGNYKSTPAAVTGVGVYQTTLSGDPVGDIGTGLYTVTQESSMQVKLHNGVWGSFGIIDFEEPQASADTTAPVISGPANLNIQLNSGDTSLSNTHASVVAWLNQFSALDDIEGVVGVSHDVPSNMLLSNSPIVVTFTATDGTNSSSLQRLINITLVSAGTLSGTLRNPDGSIPSNMTGLSMALYLTAQDLQLNTNLVETVVDVSVTAGAFSKTGVSAAAGTYFMRLFNPNDYSKFSFGQIAVV